MLQPNLKMFLHKSGEFLILSIPPCRPAVLGAFIPSLQLWPFSHQFTSNWREALRWTEPFIPSPPWTNLLDLSEKGKSPLDQWNRLVQEKCGKRIAKYKAEEGKEEKEKKPTQNVEQRAEIWQDFPDIWNSFKKCLKQVPTPIFPWWET